MIVPLDRSSIERCSWLKKDRPADLATVASLGVMTRLAVILVALTLRAVAGDPAMEENCKYDANAFALCGRKCRSEPKGRARADCGVTCLMEHVEGLRGHCAGCFGAQLDCALSNCFYICPRQPASAFCRRCRRERCSPCGDEDDDSNDEEGEVNELRP
ncbi:unnamed protein product [Cladocopium goreaui]|uniref:Uncharacterized protein n=1 Tax=Cladocopium goreaui TaxID=2562237 RepID=A0A9P1GQG8_9DINO|nr:unnamed protein product [Cladocopium goreaui]